MFSFLSSELMGQFTSADMWKYSFVLITFQTQLLTKSWFSQIWRLGKYLFFFLSSVFSWWLLLVGIYFPLSDRQWHVFVNAPTIQNTSVLSPSAYLNTHVLENKQFINPHTQREFCPEGAEGKEEREEEVEEGVEGGWRRREKRQKEKEWGRKLQCGQKSAFSISWGGSGLDQGELQPAVHTKEYYHTWF